MKKTLLLAASFLVLTSVTAFAEGPYAGADLALSIAHDSDVSGGGTVKYDTGFGFDLRGGYNFNQGRVEAEFGYRTNDLKDFNGDASVMSYMLNGYYDFKIDAPVTPFVGLGFGLLNGDFDGDSDTTFGGQAILGVAYPLNKQVNIDLTYKYLTTLSDFEAGGVKVDYSNSSVLIGARYNF